MALHVEFQTVAFSSDIKDDTASETESEEEVDELKNPPWINTKKLGKILTSHF